MKFKNGISSSLLIALLLIGCKNVKTKEMEKEPVDQGSYELVKDWPKLPEGFILGSPTGLGVDSDNNILVFHRASRAWVNPVPETRIMENTILTLDKNTGEILKSWGTDLFIMPHGLEVDEKDNIWVTDVALHQVFKFSSSGKLLLTLGEANISGNDATHFNLPTDIAVASDGSFYVSDGYGNSRVVKFAKDGTYLFEWGKPGKGNGEFKIPHSIDCRP
jgi:peptidylamidoglycolate lyase